MSETDDFKRPKEICAPWSDEQVAALNLCQANPGYHPFTCGVGGHGHGVLNATTGGWRCAKCDYEQDWAWASSVEIAGTLPRFYQQIADKEKASAA